jgi:hypothetical protein
MSEITKQKKHTPKALLVAGLAAGLAILPSKNMSAQEARILHTHQAVLAPSQSNNVNNDAKTVQLIKYIRNEFMLGIQLNPHLGIAAGAPLYQSTATGTAYSKWVFQNTSMELLAPFDYSKLDKNIPYMEYIGVQVIADAESFDESYAKNHGIVDQNLLPAAKLSRVSYGTEDINGVNVNVIRISKLPAEALRQLGIRYAGSIPPQLTLNIATFKYGKLYFEAGIWGSDDLKAEANASTELLQRVNSIVTKLQKTYNANIVDVGN